MNDLAILLTTEGGKPFYLQIYEYIKDEIREGKLTAGDKLPSTRSLAGYLQVARSTVDFAYGQLVAEGYLEARPCKGYFVSQMEELLDFGAAGQNFGVAGLENGAEDSRVRSKESGGNASGKGAGEQADYGYDFSPHGTSLKHFPFATWKKITRNILVDANSEMFALGDAQGDYRLRETIGRYLHSSRGVNCTPEQIIVGAGNDYLFMLLEKILGRHVPIAMEEPTYKRAYRVFSSFAYQIQVLPMDESGMQVEALQKTDARVAYVMPSHQFPTGVVMPIGRRLELLRWAGEAENRYLIEDDYDSEFRYRGKPVPSLQASDRSGRVIYMGTFSKSIAPAIRVGYMVLPQKLLKIYRENCGFYASTVSRIDQRILDEFIREGHFERYLNKMRKIYREKHDYLLNLLQPFERAFAISGENAGLHILLTSKKGISEEELLRAAEAEGIRLYGISEACAVRREKEKSAGPGTVLMGYGALDKPELEQGVRKLQTAWHRFL